MKIEDCKHPGLLLFRFFNKLADEKEKETRVPIFVRKANEAYREKRFQDLLDAIQQRQQKDADACRSRDARVVRLETIVDWRLAAGLSYGRLEETGFHLHPLYGLPYLPASGIRGALHHWTEESEGKESEFLKRIFGGESTARNKVSKPFRGLLQVFDAFPLPMNGSPQNLLALDILNKHHNVYFQNSVDPKPPADYENPEPVRFFTVARGIRFSFTFALRPPAIEDDERKVSRLVTECFTFSGLGAKTAKGYGRLTTL